MPPTVAGRACAAGAGEGLQESVDKWCYNHVYTPLLLKASVCRTTVLMRYQHFCTYTACFLAPQAARRRLPCTAEKACSCCKQAFSACLTRLPCKPRKPCLRTGGAVVCCALTGTASRFTVCLYAHSVCKTCRKSLICPAYTQVYQPNI